MPGAVHALGDLGVDPPGHDYRGIRYTDGKRSAEALFAGGSGRGVRRTALHDALAAAVRDAGVPIHQRKIGTVVQDDKSVLAAGFTARYLAAADGLHSPIRTQFELDGVVSRRRRYGLRRHYAVAPWTDLVEVHWTRRAEAYVTPVDENLVGVAILSELRGPFEHQLRLFPQLADRLPEPVTATRGSGPLRQRVRARVAGRVLLVGDAAGYVDALTGEGIAVSLGSAAALVDCVSRGRPGDYEREWLRVSRRYRWITSTLLWSRRRPGVPQLIVPTAIRLPRVFSSAVNQLAG